jgi:hypothetical protein
MGGGISINAGLKRPDVFAPAGRLRGRAGVPQNEIAEEHGSWAPLDV